MNPTPTLSRALRLSAALLASLLLPSLGLAATPAVLDHQHPGVRAVMAVQAEATAGLMNVPAILGTAVGLDAADQPVLVVYVDQSHAGMAAAVRAVPPQLRGVASQIELTEKFRAYAGKPGGGGTGTTIDHKAKQLTPVKLGTSGGWREDLANGYCCGGTLGALIQVSGVKFILSNYHVFEADIIPGGNNNVATTGQYILQPGLIDVSCVGTNAQQVGILRQIGSLPASNVDCSIAQIIPGMVDESGAILAIGTISSTTAPAALRQAVKKSGRTTGFTRSSVSGLNATLSVTYENECAGGTAFTKTFTGQIVVANKASKFLASGDSGSLMVQDVANSPKAVGLLFAGSTTTAIANPIDEVLTFIGTKTGGAATLVGN